MRAKRTHQMSIYEAFSKHEIEPCPMWYEPEREFVFPMRYEPEAKNLRRIVKWVDHCKDDDQHERNTALYD